MFQDVAFYSPIGNISIIFSFSSARETSFLVQNEIEPEQVTICMKYFEVYDLEF